MRQFEQHILPMGWSQSNAIGPTTVWSYGSGRSQAGSRGRDLQLPGPHHRGQAQQAGAGEMDQRPGGLSRAHYLPHLFAVDQTLHWANPAGGRRHATRTASARMPYTGPVPIVTHVHGAHTTEESDGYPEAWYLPAANDIPAGYAPRARSTSSSSKAEAKQGQPGSPARPTFQYPNDQRATTLWYHDHTLGMTGLNVYAGPAGFYLLRGGGQGGRPGCRSPLPSAGRRPGPSTRDPDRHPGSLLQRRRLALLPRQPGLLRGLNVPGGAAVPGAPTTDPVHPDAAWKASRATSRRIWNPEFFGNTMVVNGRTWPFLDVEQRRYRFRLLNGCNSRFLMLQMDNGCPSTRSAPRAVSCPAPVMLNQVLMSPAERAM